MKRSFWVNVYPNDVSGSYPTRQIADRMPYPNSRLALVEFIIEDGKLSNILKHDLGNKCDDMDTWVDFITDKRKDG